MATKISLQGFIDNNGLQADVIVIPPGKISSCWACYARVAGHGWQRTAMAGLGHTGGVQTLAELGRALEVLGLEGFLITDDNKLAYAKDDMR